MGKPSMMMLGSHMTLDLDEGSGRTVGSMIRLRGRMLGIALELQEAIVERVVPFRKVWQTVGTPRLLVIAHYRMGFELTPDGEGCRVRVFIDYSLPTAGWARVLGKWFGGFYARWCVRRMADDAARHFRPGGATVRAA